MNDEQTLPRSYRKMDKEQLASFKALEVLLGNGSAAIRAMIPDYKQPHVRAFRARKKSIKMNTVAFIDEQLEQIGVDAVNRIGDVVSSPDEKTALKASTYVIDHLKGKPTQKSVSLSGKFNIQNVLE